MKRILHMTHKRNLPQILRAGGLYAATHPGLPGSRASIADPEVNSRRSHNRVLRADGTAASRGGVVHDYVPFYFCERSPMLYRNRRDETLNPDGQEAIVYLVSSIDRVTAAGLPWAFSNMNAASPMASYFDDLSDLGEIDWDSVYSTNWGRNHDPSGRVQRHKSAEFLVHQFVPLDIFEHFATIDRETQAEVVALLQATGCAVPVKTRRSWYF